jgi:hypothetical protein
MFGYLKVGWGSLRVMVTIGESTWQTSIFPDKKSSCNLLPIKKEIRVKESITENKEIKLKLEIKV